MRVTILLLMGCMAIGDSAQAATNIKCVGSSNDLTQALSTLSNSPDNIDADEIRIRAGTYFAPAGGWTGSVTTHHDLSIRGGYMGPVTVVLFEDSCGNLINLVQPPA